MCNLALQLNQRALIHIDFLIDFMQRVCLYNLPRLSSLQTRHVVQMLGYHWPNVVDAGPV